MIGTHETAATIQRRLPVGAEVVDGGTHFRVWAPARKSVEVLVDGDAAQAHALTSEASGYFSGFIQGAGPGVRYLYRLDAKNSYPDPASRFQPLGPHGPSEVVDARAFEWTDANWPGIHIEGQVLYEMHAGTFTREGTWEAAMAELPRLADLGITALEVMPVAEFPGRFGWGYDGTLWFAPTRLYGRPDDFRRFVDRAHAHAIGVILDVVYNHFGPDGNYLKEFTPEYFSPKKTEWGDALNFDGELSPEVRAFVLANVRYWIEEFHLDGFRLDATQQIFDTSPDHIVAAITRETRRAAGNRKVIVIAENEPNHMDLVRSPDRGGFGLDALWNDDFHHAAAAALTGHNPAYYSGYSGAPQEFISAIKYGSLYQGQVYYWQKKRRGMPALDLHPSTSILFLENHDQVANSATGARIQTLSHPGDYRAMTALFLLAPGTPLLFQGQEFGSRSPFYYFADHHPELLKQVELGRLEFLSQLPNLATADLQTIVPGVGDLAAFERCKLVFEDNEHTHRMLALHRDLLRLRRSDAAFQVQSRGGVDGAVLAPYAFVLRFLTGGPGDRLLLVNLGMDLHLVSPAEPLLAPPRGREWKTLWSSEEPAYGGVNMPRVECPDGWKLPGHSAVVLAADPDA
jgi:maltooligosyltrehalose trehalohydrolase